jgi:dynein light chain roadblock-type
VAVDRPLGQLGAIIRYSGVAFEGEQGRKYAVAVKKIVDCCRTNLEEIGEEGVSVAC